MRTLTSTLLATQKENLRDPYFKMTFSKTGSDDVVIEQDRIKLPGVTQEEWARSQKLAVFFDNSDGYFTSLDLKGWSVVPAWGLKTSAGIEYSTLPPMTVMEMVTDSRPRYQTAIMWFVGIPDLLEMDKSLKDYSNHWSNTKTVKDLITEIADGEPVDTELTEEQIATDDFFTLPLTIGTTDTAGAVNATTAKGAVYLPLKNLGTGEICRGTKLTIEGDTTEYIIQATVAITGNAATVRISPGLNAQALVNAAVTLAISSSGTPQEIGKAMYISNRTVTKVAFKLKKVGTPTGNITFRISQATLYDDGTVVVGSNLASKTLDVGTQLTVTSTIYELTLTDALLVNERVWLECLYSGGDATNYVCIAINSAAQKENEMFVLDNDSATPNEEWELSSPDLWYRYKYTAGTGETNGVDCFEHCHDAGLAYTVTYDSVDSIIDTFAPADGFSIAEGESRLSVIFRLLGYTNCDLRVEADGALHVFLPIVDTLAFTTVGDGWCQSPRNTPSGYYYNGYTYVVYQGPKTTGDGDPYITRYCHATGVWDAAVKVGTNTATSGSLTACPCVIVRTDSGHVGKILVVWGGSADALDDVQWAESTNAEDITAWGAAASVGLTDGQWYNLIQVASGDIYLFSFSVATYGNYKRGYVKMTAGGATWAGATIMLDCSAATAGQLHCGAPVYDSVNDKIWFPTAWYNNTSNNYETIWVIGFKPSDGKVYDIAGNSFTLPVTKANLNSGSYKFQVFTIAGAEETLDEPSLDLDSNKYPHVVYTYTADGTNWNLRYTKWSGSAWASPTNIANSSTVPPQIFWTSASDIDIYGNMASPFSAAKFHFDGTSWTATSLLVAKLTDSIGFTNFTRVYGYQSNFKVMWCDWVSPSRTNQGVYAYAGFYEYALGSGNHEFFSKAIRNALVTPNKITVHSHPNDTDQYTGSATDATSYALLPKELSIRAKLTSSAQAVSIATAMIARLVMDSQQGSFEATMNLGAEIHDYVKVTDAWASDSRTGNLGYIKRTYIPGKEFNMFCSFGNRIANKTNPLVPSRMPPYRPGPTEIEEIAELLSETITKQDNLAEKVKSLDDEMPDAVSVIGFMKQLKDDLTPQLGGDLDAGTHNIIPTTDGTSTLGDATHVWLAFLKLAADLNANDKNINPATTGAGSLGTSLLHWLQAFIDNINVGDLVVDTKITMQSHPIQGLLNPVTDQDAATKHSVISEWGGATIASDNIKNSNDASKSTQSETWVKLKEIKIVYPLASIRVFCTLAVAVCASASYRLVKNSNVDNPLGGHTVLLATGSDTFSDDITGLVKDDLIQIYASVIDSAGTGTVSNFRFGYDTSNYIVPVTNQDPE